MSLKGSKDGPEPVRFGFFSLDDTLGVASLPACKSSWSTFFLGDQGSRTEVSFQKFARYFPSWAWKGCRFFRDLESQSFIYLALNLFSLDPHLPRLPLQISGWLSLSKSLRQICTKINKNHRFELFWRKKNAMKNHTFFVGAGRVGGNSGHTSPFRPFPVKVNWAVKAAIVRWAIQRWRVKATTSTVNRCCLASHWVAAIYLPWMALLLTWWPGCDGREEVWSWDFPWQFWVWKPPGFINRFSGGKVTLTFPLLMAKD